MELGNFSVSLAVKDLAASRAFYEKLGFAVFGGDQAQNWLILKNGDVRDRPVPGHVRAGTSSPSTRAGTAMRSRSRPSPTCASCSAS